MYMYIEQLLIDIPSRISHASHPADRCSRVAHWLGCPKLASARRYHRSVVSLCECVKKRNAKWKEREKKKGKTKKNLKHARLELDVFFLYKIKKKNHQPEEHPPELQSHV